MGPPLFNNSSLTLVLLYSFKNENNHSIIKPTSQERERKTERETHLVGQFSWWFILRYTLIVFFLSLRVRGLPLCPQRMCASCFRFNTPHLAQSEQPRNVYSIHFQVCIALRRNGGRRDLNWLTLMANVTGCVSGSRLGKHWSSSN